MLKYISFVLSFFLFFQPAFSQTDADKVFFDRSGKSASETQAYYYRQKTDGDSYKSYYVNGGTVYFEGKIIKANNTDESQDVYTETCTWYYKSGKVKARRTFDDKGIENGVSDYYFETGKIWKEIEFVHGKMAESRYKEFDEDGQSSRIFEENFTSNDNDWDLYSSDKSSAALDNGFLTLTSLSKEGTSRYINAPIQSSDFTIEAVINIDKLNQGDKAGIIYGFKDWQNYNFFYISSSSLYIGMVYEGVSALKADGMYADAVKAKGENSLKIIGNGEKSIYSINGEVQYSSGRLRNSGSNIGFAVGGKSTISADKLIVKEIDFKSTESSTSHADIGVKATGSGLIFSRDGYILTNNHVIKDANKIIIEVNDGDGFKSYTAAVMQKDADNDLAILKINDASFKNTDPIPFSFKESGSVDVGASVFTIGYPYALSGMGKEAKFTDGKISSKTGYNNAINTYQTSIPVQPGNSGGPLFNDKCQLIGVVNSKVTSADNVSYAIKLNYVRNLIELLPGSVDIPNSQGLNSSSTEEKVKAVSKFVVLIKIK